MTSIRLLSQIASVLREVNATLALPADDPRRDVVRARVAETLAAVDAAGATAQNERADQVLPRPPEEHLMNHLRPQRSAPGTATSLSGQTYDAALDRDGAVWIDRTPWARGGWMVVPRYGYTFAADDVPEWVTSCVHERICDTEGACVALLREDVTA